MGLSETETDREQEQQLTRRGRLSAGQSEIGDHLGEDAGLGVPAPILV